MTMFERTSTQRGQRRRTPVRPAARTIPGHGLLACALLLVAFTPVFGGDLEIDGTFVSTVPPGAPPLDVSSSTRVDGLNADHLDGMDAGAFAPAVAQVVWVSHSGGHFSSVQDALAAITDASHTNRYLIRVAPGVYDGHVTMKPYVNIQGAGRDATVLRQVGGTTVEGASEAALRDLTVQNLDDGIAGGRGIHNLGAGPAIERVKVRVEATVAGAEGIRNEPLPSGAPAPRLRDVRVAVLGPEPTGIVNEISTVGMRDLEVYVNGEDAVGIYNLHSYSTMRRVLVSARLFPEGPGSQVGIQNSFSPVSMVDVEVEVDGGDVNYGVRNFMSSGRVTMTRLDVTATGGSHTYALHNSEGAFDLVDSLLWASGGGTSNTALWNDRAAGKILRSELRASGGKGSYALTNHDSDSGGSGGPWVVHVHSSQLWCDSAVVINPAKFYTRIGASSLAGGAVSNSGTLVCASVYDETFVSYPDTCP